MHATVLICTYNRARLLAQTLDTLAAVEVRPDLRWEVLVVDNNSSDETRELVERRAAAYPAPLRYLFEKRQGKAYALNTGIAASAAQIVVFVDDDVRIGRHWLEAGVRPLLERDDIDYTGGPAHGTWEAPPPDWLSADPGRVWGPVALVDYGRDEFIFEERHRIPLGVNMAVRRTLIDRVGGFHLALERKGTSLMGQGQAEFFFRTRAAGARGLYVPRMSLRHFVPAHRLTRRYHLRWWYWKGVARAHMQDFHPVDEFGVNLTTIRFIGGTPRFMWGTAVRRACAWMGAIATANRFKRVECEADLAYFLGYVRTRRARRHNAERAPEAAAELSSSTAASTAGAVVTTQKS